MLKTTYFIYDLGVNIPAFGANWDREDQPECQECDPGALHFIQRSLIILGILFIISMAKNPTPFEFTASSPADIKLSTWEYNDFIDAFNDDRLSARALMKFKELYRLNSMQQLVAPLVAFPFAWVANRWLVGSRYVMQAS